MDKIDDELLRNVFDLWAQRYAENPEIFDSILDEDGSPMSEYGTRCAQCFTALVAELQQGETHA